MPEFEELIDETSIAMNDKFKTKKHHEDTAGFQVTFVNGVQKLYSSINCNPFEISKLTTIHNGLYARKETTLESST